MDAITIIGTLATIQVASVAGLYMLVKAELRAETNGIRGEMKNLRSVMEAGFKRQEMLLKLNCNTIWRERK